MKSTDNNEQCPYIMSDDQVQKLKELKKLLLQNIIIHQHLLSCLKKKLSLRPVKEGFKAMVSYVSVLTRL